MSDFAQHLDAADDAIPARRPDLDAAPDAADETGRKRKIAKAKDLAREAREFWDSVFASPVGRREMWGLINGAEPFKTIFATSPSGFPQPEATWFHAGARDLAQRIYGTWQATHPEAAILMRAENDPAFAAMRGAR